MTGLVRGALNALPTPFPKEPNYDPESQLTRTERCCFPNYICRHVSLYFATPPLFVAVPIAAWGYYSKDYLLASIVTLLAVTILGLAIVIWFQTPWANMGHNIHQLNQENVAAFQRLRALGHSEGKLLTAENQLSQQVKIDQDNYAELMTQHQAVRGELLQVKKDLVASIERCEKLEKEIESIKRTALIISQDLKSVGKMNLDDSVAKIKSERARFETSVNRLDDAVTHLDLGNKNYDGENAELAVLLSTFRDTLKTREEKIRKLEFIVEQFEEAGTTGKHIEETAAHISAATSALDKTNTEVEELSVLVKKKKDKKEAAREAARVDAEKAKGKKEIEMSVVSAHQ